MRARRIICCESHTGDPNWRWVASAFASDPVEWEFFHRLPRTFLQRHVHSPDLALIDAARRATAAVADRTTDLIVSHEPRTTLWCSTFATLRGLHVPHVAHAFNFCHLPSGTRLRTMRKAFSRVDHFVTFSTVERDLYAKHFDIPRSRIEVVLWGVRPPEPAETSPHVPQHDYICALGGNRRDYATLFAAMEKLPDVHLVAVLRPHNLQGLRVPPNVSVRCMIPIPDAMAILKNSRFMVLPLDSGVVPCGHITMVSAMHSAKAFVATDSPGIRDYAAHDFNSLIIPPANPPAMAAAIRELWNDPARTATLAANGADFAARHCTESATVDHVRALLRRMSVLPTAVPPTTTPPVLLPAA